MFTLLLACSPLLCPAPRPQDEARPAAALEVRRFALPFVREASAPAAMQLLPYLRSEALDNRNFPEVRDSLTPDVVLELVEALVAPEGWNEGTRSLAIDADGRLVVRAESPRLAEVAAVIGYLGESLLSPQAVVLERYPFADAEASFASSSALVDAATAERLLASGRESGALGPPQRWTVQALPTRWARAGGQREVMFLRDLDVEIADATTIADPWIDRYRLGTIAHLSASHAQGGTQVQLMLEHGETLGGDGAKTLNVYRELTGDQGELNRTTQEFPTRQPVIGFATLALSAEIPTGSELLLVERARGPRGHAGHVLRVKPQASRDVPKLLEIGDAALALRDISALVATRFFHASRLSPGLLAPHGRYSGEADSASDLVAAPPLDASLLRELIEAHCGSDELAVEEYAGTLLLQGKKALVASALRFLDEAFSRPRALYDLHLELRDRSGQRTYAEVALALSQDSDAFVSIGSDELVLHEYDVEIACHSATVDPTLSPVSHGLLARVRAEAQGELLVVDLELVLHWMAATVETSALPSWKDAQLELPSGLLLRIAEPFVLGAGASADTGDLDPSGADGLVLRITRRG